MQWVYANHQIGKRDPRSEHFLSTQTFLWWSTTSSKTWNIETHWSALLDWNGSPQCLTLDIRNSLCEGLGIGPVRLRHRSHHFATWSSHFVDSTVWQTKKAPNEIRLKWRNPHGPFSLPVKLINIKQETPDVCCSEFLQRFSPNRCVWHMLCRIEKKNQEEQSSSGMYYLPLKTCVLWFFK